MRFEYDAAKNREVLRKHGVSLDAKNDDPEQFRAIGWAGGRLCSVVFEIRRDSHGEDEIAELATRGRDISGYFTNQFTVVKPVRRVNVDLTQGMLRELDERAAKLNISRQAVIKTLLRQALDADRPPRASKRRQAS